MTSSFTPSYPITPTPPLQRPVTNDIELTAADITAYRENGYHVVHDLLSPEQLEQWRKIIFTAVQDRGDKKYKFPVANEEDHTNVDFDYYDNVFTQRVNLWQTHPAVKELLLESGSVIGKIAAQLEGLDCIRIWHDQALIKESFANPTAWYSRFHPLAAEVCHSIVGTSMFHFGHSHRYMQLVFGLLSMMPHWKMDACILCLDHIK